MSELPVTKPNAVKSAYDDLQRLTQDVRAVLLRLSTGNEPERATLVDMADRARKLARRQSRTLLGTITVEDADLTQTRESFKKIADDLASIVDFKNADNMYPVLTDAARALNRALGEVPRPNTDGMRNRISHLLRRGSTGTRPAAPAVNVEGIVAKAQRLYKEQTAKLAKQLVDEKISIEQWRQDMMRAIRDLHYTAAVAGAGGIGYLTPAALAGIDAKVREQGTYLNRWASQLESLRQEKKDINEAALQRRAAMYSGSAMAMANETADTVRFASFPKLPCYPVDGLTLCKGNCKCKDWDWNIISEERGDADVYYRLSPAEHCQVCVERARVFSPLEIRGFRIVTDYDPQKIIHR